MNFLYLSPHFPANYVAFSEQLKNLGANVLGVGDASYDQLSPRLKQALTEYYRVDDLHNYEALKAACEHFRQRYGPIDRVDSHAEYWLETEARLRTDFGIPGIRNDTILTIKRKSKMKEVFRNAGVNVARGRVCTTVKEALDLAKETGYPLVAKPDNGVGAAATFKLHNDDEIKKLFQTPPPTDYIFEEFIAGDITSFDGLTDRDGNLVFYTAHRYDKGIMETVLDNDHIFYYSLRDIPKDLEEAGKKTVKAFNVRERFFHFEFFRTHKDGKIVALEVNIRPPGGFTTDMFNFANDFDIYHQWASILVNNKFTTEWSRPYHVIYISRKDHMPYTFSHHEILERYRHLLCLEARLPEVYATALGNHGYIARSPELEPLLTMAGDIHKLNTHTHQKEHV